MSLVGMALRIVTVKALTGATFAESRVFDSSIAALDEKVGEGGGPLLVVYTDEEDLRDLDGTDMMCGARDLSLTIHFAVASSIKANAGGIAVEMPHTDEGLEVVLDIMRHQVIRTLQAGTGLWPELWRCIVKRVPSLSVRRGAGAQKGLRFAARELVLHVDTLADPAPVKEARTNVWPRLIEALRVDSDTTGIADLLEAQLAPQPTLADWQVAAATLGLTNGGVSGTGLGPVPGLPEDEAPLPVLETVVLADDDGGAFPVEPEP